jgi:hypothetical protein
MKWPDAGTNTSDHFFRRADSGANVWLDTQGLRQVMANVRWHQQRESTVKITVLTGLTDVIGQLRPDGYSQVFQALDPYWSWPDAHVCGIRSNQATRPVTGLCEHALVATVRFEKRWRGALRLVARCNRTHLTGGWVRSQRLITPKLCNSWISLGSYINRRGSAPRHLSWHFDILDILVSLSKHLPLISIHDSSSKWDWEWFQVYLLEWLHLVTLGDRCGCELLVTLSGCCHLDGLEQWWRSGTCWWLFGAGSGNLVKGIAPFPAKCRKVALVNCSCHWVTSLMSWFLQCPTCGQGSCDTS